MTSTTLETVERIFWICNTSKTPVRRFSSACSKIGWLSRSANEPDLHYLESALNEQKHGILMGQLAAFHDRENNPARASEIRKHESMHFDERDCYLASFERAVKRAVRNLTEA